MAHAAMRHGFTRRAATFAFAVALVAPLSSCGLLGGSEGSSPSESDGPLEAPDITVSIMKTTDLAPFHLAVQKGFFTDEGLSVTTVDAKSSGDSADNLTNGNVDIAYSSYPPFFYAEATNVARNLGGIKLVADASSCGPDACVVVALPDAPVKSVKDMDGKRVAVSSTNSISVLLTKSTMNTNGVDSSDVEWVPTPFPQVAQKLKSGEVDAAFATEPWIQDAQKNAGAVTVFDTAEGPTANMASAGWASTGNYVKDHPNTVAAFQRAMQRGTELALADRSLVEPILVEHTQVDEDTAKMAVLLTFQSRLDASRIQRVPDLMLEFGEIKKDLDVNDMIVPTAPLD